MSDASPRVYLVPRRTTDKQAEQVRYGSLTSTPDGRLYTLQGPSTPFVSPQGAQQLWVNTNQSRYPKEWHARYPPPGVRVVWWHGPVRFDCGRCRGSLGDYVGYHCHTEWGVVEDTTHHYLPGPLENWSGAPSQGGAWRKPRYSTPFRLENSIARARECRIVFTCFDCRLEYEWRLSRLGHRLMTERPEAFLLDRPRPLSTPVGPTR